MKKCVIVGYGGMGSWHAKKIKEEMGEFAELVGVFDINPERKKVADEEGMYFFSSSLSFSKILLALISARFCESTSAIGEPVT